MAASPIGARGSGNALSCLGLLDRLLALAINWLSKWRKTGYVRDTELARGNLAFGQERDPRNDMKCGKRRRCRSRGDNQFCTATTYRNAF